MKKIYLGFKRFFDILISTLVLLSSFPMLIIIGIVIKITSDGKVLYTHRRIRKNGKTIHVLKFRTMVNDERPLDEILTEEQLKEYKKSFKITDDPRVTKFGKLLRRTSLDELPQLINIIKGDMSIVGPRPVILDELKLYGENKELFLSVRPGLTGYWASHGRSDTTYDERIEMELYYVKNMSLWLDIKIIFLTAINVITGKGAK
jgi:lipopolysaccharide/colanic/teichoic acid biosynthesis glycosyltransferase